MADLPHGQGHHPKRQQPSRLRIEYRPSSTDNENMSNDQSVLVHDSQTVVPETQLEHGHDDRGSHRESERGDKDPPLTPTTAAFLDKHAVKKRPAEKEPSPFKPIKLFSKENFNLEPEVRFNFASQIRKARDNAPAKVKSPQFQPIAGDGPAVSGLDQPASKASNGQRAPKAASGSSSTAVAEVARQCPDVSQARQDNSDSLAPASLGLTAASVPSGNMRNDSNQPACDESLPSAQPSASHADGVKKVRNPKKKKIRNLPVPPARSAPWPPRPSDGLWAEQRNSPAATAPVPREEPSRSSSLPTQYPDGDISQASPLDVDATDARPKSLHDDHQLRASAPLQSEGEAEAEALLPDTSQVPTPTQGTHEEVNYLPHQSFEVPGMQRSHLTSKEPSLPMEAGVIPCEPGHIDQSEPKYVPTSPRSAGRHSVRRQGVGQTHNQQPELVVLEHIDSHAADAQWAPDLQRSMETDVHHRRVGEPSHTVSQCQGRPYRVEKPPKKKRVASGPQSLTASAPPRNRAPVVQNSFEQSLEELRITYMTEKYRKEHDTSTQAKQFEETEARLRNEVDVQSANAAEWKGRYEGLNTNVGQLREKARTNQKFVSGLQKDYEKLQRSVATHETECKKVLQEKITEVEREKQELRRDFERTLEQLSKGQRNLRQTTDDLYVRLIISESKRKDLAENASKHVAMYEEEKAKRNDVEKKLLSSVQGVQRQLGDHSTQLIEKLGGLQTMVESAQAADHPDSDAHQCLLALRQVQNTPYLTTKDLEKAAGMLRSVHEG